MGVAPLVGTAHTMASVRRAASMDERLRLCTRALMMYSVWHPEFKGFDKSHVDA